MNCLLFLASLLLVSTSDPGSAGPPAPTHRKDTLPPRIRIDERLTANPLQSAPQRFPMIGTPRPPNDPIVEWVSSAVETGVYAYPYFYGNHLYVSENAGLRSFDLTDFDSPHPNPMYPTNWPQSKFAVQNGYLYRPGYPTQLEIYDISGPTGAPRLVNVMELGPYMNSLTAYGENYLCVAAGPNGLIMVDVSEPEQPEIISRWQDAEAYDVLVQDTLAFVLGWDDIWSLSLADPENVVTLGNTGTSITNSLVLFALHDSLLVYGFAFERGYGIPENMRVVNVADPSDLKLAGTYPQGVYVMVDVDFHDELAYASVMPYDPLHGHNLFTMDLSDPDNVILLDSLVTEGGPGYLTIQGDTLVLAGSSAGLQTFTLEDPLHPAFHGRYCDFGALVEEVELNDTLLFVADSMKSHALNIVDIHDIEHPEKLGTMPVPIPWQSIDLWESLFAVSLAEQGIHFYSIEELDTFPVERAVYYPMWAAWDVEMRGEYAYYAELPTGLHSLDISDLSDIKHLDSITPAHRNHVTLNKNRAYVSGATDELLIVDISNPAELTLIGTYNTNLTGDPFDNRDPYWKVAAYGDLVVVPLGSHGFDIFDASDPANPSTLYSDTTPCQTAIIEFPYLFVTGGGDIPESGNKELTIYNIWNPSHPTVVHHTTFYNFPWDMKVRNGYLYVAETECLNIYKLNLDWDGIAPGNTAALPENFSIVSAYPNPFNPTVTVILDLPNAGRLTLDVFNTLGQRVARLHDGRTVPGSRRFQFDGRGLTSGVYFISASLEGLTGQVRRVTLVK